MYLMMVLIMSPLVKCWFTGKYLVLHYFAYIRGITGGIDISSVQPYTRYTGLPMGCRNNISNGSIPGFMDYTIISQKSEYNKWNRWYIEILTSYPDFTSKMGPGNVPYVICRCHLIPSNFGNFYKICCITKWKTTCTNHHGWLHTNKNTYVYVAIQTFPKWVKPITKSRAQLNLCLNLMQNAYTYVTIPDISKIS